MEKSGLIINGKFFECNTDNLKIEIKGNINNLSLTDSNNDTMHVIGNGNIQLSSNNSTMTIIGNNNIQQSCKGNVKNMIANMGNSNVSTLNLSNSSIAIHISGNVNNVETTTGDVYCNEAGAVESTSGNITVNGNVQGDVESVSGDINITGKVNGDVTTTTGNIKVK